MFDVKQLWVMARIKWTLSFVLGALTLISGIALLAYSGWFISAAALAGIAGNQAGLFNYMRPGAMIRLLAIIRTTGRYAERLQSHHTMLDVLKQLRIQCFQLISQRFNMEGSQRLGRFHALQQLIADIDVLDQLPLKLLLPVAWAGLGLFIGGTFLIVWQPDSARIVIGCSVGLLVVIPWVQLAMAGNIATRDALMQSQRREQLLEQLAGLTTLTMLGQQQAFLTAFDSTELASAESQRRMQQVTSLGAVLQQLILAGLVVYFVLATTEPSPPLLIAACLGVLGLNELLKPLTQIHQIMGSYHAAHHRLTTLETSAVAIQPQAPLTQSQASLTLCELSWPFSQVEPLSFHAKRGDMVLIRGHSGIGKSSLLATIAGALPILSGQIQWGGPLTRLTWLDQQPYIFALSIAGNLRIAKPTATDAELHAILALVELDTWLCQQPEGLKSSFDSAYLGLSGGEMRRFALARCLLRQADLVLLDEPFAGLSAAQASRILGSIKANYPDTVCLVISHQWTDLSEFSQVVTLTSRY